MRQFTRQYLEQTISRRSFVRRLTAAGVAAPSARAALAGLEPLINPSSLPASARKTIKGTGGDLLAEQLIASGVRYVFGNSGSGDAGFYEALVHRPQLRYVMCLHESAVAAMAAGYAKASGEPGYACVSGAVGLVNAMGGLYNAHKDRTKLVVVAYKREASNVSGRDIFEEVQGQEDMTIPVSKWRWIATRAETIPEIVRRGFKVASTPPFGPVYLGWNHDLLLESTEAEVIEQAAFNAPVNLRPGRKEVERAARMLVEAASPIMIAGDEIYKSNALPEAVRLAELLGAPVTTTRRECFCNFPQAHPLHAGVYSSKLRFPKTQDVVLNLGSRTELLATGPLFPEKAAFIDMRVDSGEVAKIFPTDVPLVCTLKEGLTDLIAAVESLLTPALKTKIQERFAAARQFTAAVRKAQLDTLMRSEQWNASPLLPARLSYEIGRLLDQDAFVAVENIDAFGLNFDPINGRTFVACEGGSSLGWGAGVAAGMKLARPNNQAVLLVGDGSFIFGPHALWTMARNEIPVIIVVFNNQSYNSVKDRVLGYLPEGAMRETGRIVPYYIGSPDVQMVALAAGFGVKGERISAPAEIAPAMQRALAATRDGKPYLIDAQIARSGMWGDAPWYPQLSLAHERNRKV
ncbi:MAG: thiamine pyrophosphate-binding protein [Blastocatellia bacterium]